MIFQEFFLVFALLRSRRENIMQTCNISHIHQQYVNGIFYVSKKRNGGGIRYEMSITSWIWMKVDVLQCGPCIIYIKQLSTRWQIPYKSCKVESKDQHHCKQNYLSSRITCHRHQQSSKIKKTNKKNIKCSLLSFQCRSISSNMHVSNAKFERWWHNWNSYYAL